MEGQADGLNQSGLGSGFEAPQEVFDFAPHLFNRIEVRRVGWQKKNLGSGLGDQVKGHLIFMWPKVVHHHHVSWAQRRTEDFPNVGLEDLCVGGAINGHAGRRAVQSDGTDHGGGLPVTVRSAGMDTCSFGSPAAQAGQVGLGTRFIQKDQPGRVKTGLPAPPEAARPGDVGTVLLTGTECLFLYVRPNFSKA